MSRCRPGDNRGFSLTELLVIVAIMGVLCALALPTFQRSQQKVEKLGCASNLRQIGSYIQLYATDNNGSLPGPAFLAVGQSLKLTRGLLTQINKSIALSTSEDQNCPFAVCPTADKLSHKARPATHFRRISSVPDGTGSFFDPFGYAAESVPMRVAAVAARSPVGLSRLPMVYDRNAEGLPTPMIHEGARNYLFMDGHVETLPGENPFQEIGISIN